MMRRYTIYDLLTVIVAGLCLCGLLTACGEDRDGDLPDDEPNDCIVTIILRTSQSTRPQTKAGENITWADDDTYERDITDWLVVAYDQYGELAGYTSSKGTYNKDADDSRTAVEMKLPIGTYHFYAFANLESLEGGATLLATIQDPGSDESSLNEAVNILASGNSIDGRNAGKFGGTDGNTTRKRIPMSSYAQEKTLSPSENIFEIPLIRMIGKVQVEITNNLTQPITVNQLDIMNLRKGSLPIWLLPWGTDNYLEFEGNVDLEQPLVPSFPSAGESVEENLFNEEMVPADDNTVSANGGKTTYTRYIPETNAAVGGIQLGVEIEGRPRTEHLTGFDFVRRNDLLVIPIRLTNITTTLKIAEQRLPIGVYPTTLTYGAENGVQVLTPFKHTLQAAGDLSIRFEITSIEGVEGAFAIKGQPTGEIPEPEKFSFINWTKNDNDNENAQPLITGISMDGGKTFKTEAGNVNIPQATLDESKKAGSFTIRTQELGGKAEATIILTLVVNYTADRETQEMQIPYTIKIRNYKETTQP